MKKMNWGFVVVTAESLTRVRQINFSTIFLVIVLAITIAGFAGMGRLILFTSTYASAKFGVYEARRENRGLMMKIKFINKFIDQENQKIYDLVRFEDNIRLQYGMDKISEDVRKAGVGGRPSPEELLLSTLLDPVLIRAESIRDSLSVMLRKTQLQDSTLSRVTDNVTKMKKKWAQRPSIWPTDGRVTSYFGNRFHPIEEQVLFHDGLDIANKTGTPIYAPADGIVKFVGIQENYGRMITINHHDSNCETIYGHLQQAEVSSGQIIHRGDLIGFMGSTGRSTGSHLHYEVRVNEHAIDPFNYILPTDVVVD
jgi:murein DD-endopeptidase MepM/ murein hydrolase activator NlpD